MASWAAMAAKPAAAPAPAPAAAPLVSNDVVSAGTADGSGVAANGAQPVLSSADEALRDLRADLAFQSPAVGAGDVGEGFGGRRRERVRLVVGAHASQPRGGVVEKIHRRLRRPRRRVQHQGRQQHGGSAARVGRGRA